MIRKIKGSLLILYTLIMILGLTSCFTFEAPEEPETQDEAETFKITMITSEGGLGDESFNDTAYEGLLRASDDYKIETSLLEPDSEDYIDAVSQAASDEADMVIAVGMISEDSIAEIAQEYPDTCFVVFDSEIDGYDNIMSLSYKEHEGSFLVGIAAALTTQTDIVGFVGGRDDPNIDKFEYGYRAGVKAINPNAQVLVEYTGCFDDPQAGREAALLQINDGADVIFHASGECGIGVIEAAEENDIWVIGVDKDQSELNPEVVLCSMFKRVDHGVYLAIQILVEGNFDGGVYEFGLDYEAVGYIDNAGNLSNEVSEQIDYYADAILSGEIYVPKDRPEFEGFVVDEDGLL